MQSHKTIFGYKLIAIIIVALVAVGVTSYGEQKYSLKKMQNSSELPNSMGRSIQSTSDIHTADGLDLKYFGNEIRFDLDGDQSVDRAFVAYRIARNVENGTTENSVQSSTKEPATIYYAVAILSTAQGLITTDAYELGRNIFPQMTHISPDPKQARVVVFNFAYPKYNETIRQQVSQAKSVYLKVDTNSNRWGIVEPDFEGESR